MAVNERLGKLVSWAFVAYLLGLSTALLDTVFNAFFLPFQINGIRDGLNYFSQNVVANTVFILLSSAVLTAFIVAVRLTTKRPTPFTRLPLPFIFGTSVSALVVFLVAVPVNIAKLPNFFDKKSIIANALFCAGIPLLAAIFTLLGVYIRKIAARYNLKYAGITVLAVSAVIVIFGLFPGGTLFRTKPAPPADAPNVLIITIDALRRDHLSCYEDAKAETPNVEEFAARSFVLSNAHTNSPWTIPAMYTMLSSRYPSVHGADIDRRGPDEIPMLAEHFAALGYDTEAYVANSILYGELGFGRGFSTYVEVADIRPLQVISRTTVYQLLKRIREKYILAAKDNTTDWATDTLCERLEAKRDRPFFIWVHYLDPHSPLIPPEEYVEGDDSFVEKAMRFGRTKTLGSSDKVKIDDKDLAVALYKAEVEYLDYRLKDVFESIKERKLTDNTLIIITADHGEEFFEHGKYGHAKTHFNEVMAIPLIIRGAGIEPGTSDIPVSLLDIASTVMAYANVDEAGETSGTDIIALVREAESQRYSSRPVFYDQTESAPDMKSVFIAPYTVRRTGNSAREYRMFDVRKITGPEDEVTDPDPEVFKRYKSILDEWTALTAGEAEGLADGRTVEVDPARRERLEDLGYF
jgi:arylsulfatase A-like enzyme